METHQDIKRGKSIRFSGARFAEEIEQVIRGNSAGGRRIHMREVAECRKRQQSAKRGSVEPRKADAKAARVDTKAKEANIEDAKGQRS